MKKTILIFLGLAAMAVLALAGGCGSNSGNGGDGNQSADQSSTTEQDFLSTVNDMRSAVTQYADASDKAGMRNGYHDSMDQGIGNMSNMWDQMRSRCDQFSGNCPANGGATGNMSGQCMSGGHMMDQGRMGQLQGFIDSCRSAMDDFWSACGSDWGSSCQQMAGLNTQQMGGLLGQMRDTCNGWWSDGSMMNGDLGACGMMDDDSSDDDMMDDDMMNSSR